MANQLTTNNSTIQTLIDKINALPEAGSGSSIETCTVTLYSDYDSYRPYCYSYTTVDDNGNIIGAAIIENSTTEVTLNNVVCGSIVTVYWHGDGIIDYVNAIHMAEFGYYFDAYMITASAGDTATIKNELFHSGGQA